MRASFPLDPTSAFRASMSESYRQAFDDVAIREHAAIVSRRGTAQSSVAHVEIWRQLPKGVSVLCVVADDRPGLLSFICASLVLHKMDVLSAQAYTRRSRRAGARPSISCGCVATPGPTTRCRSSRRTSSGSPTCLQQLITGELSIESAAERARSTRPVPPGASTNVTFDEDDDEGLVVLTVETFDRPGLLLAITRRSFAPTCRSSRPTPSPGQAASSTGSRSSRSTGRPSGVPGGGSSRSRSSRPSTRCRGASPQARAKRERD